MGEGLLSLDQAFVHAVVDGHSRVAYAEIHAHDHPGITRR